MPDSHRHHQDPVFGGACALTCGLVFGICGAIVHRAGGHVPATQLMFVRAVFAVSVLTPFVFHQIPSVLKWDARLLWVRAVAGCVGVLTLFITMQETTVGTASALRLTTHVLVLLLSWRLLRERVLRADLLGILITVAGAVLLYAPSATRPSLYVTIVGTVGAVGGAIALIVLRMASQRFPAMLIVWTMAVALIFGALLFGLNDWVNVVGPHLWIFASLASLSLLAQILLTLAFRHLEARIVMAITLSAMPFAILASMTMGARAPTTTEWWAYALMLVGLIIIKLVHVVGAAARIEVASTQNRGVRVRSMATFRNRHFRKLVAAIAKAERLTSCEFRVHIDFEPQENISNRAADVFDQLDLASTTHRTGVLLYGCHAINAWRIVPDSGIASESTRIATSHVESLLGGINEETVTRSLQTGLRELSITLSKEFPFTHRSRNELRDEVSVSNANTIHGSSTKAR